MTDLLEELLAPPADPLVGLLVKISDHCRCGEEVAQIGESAGPHRAALRCYDCGRHRGWLSHEAGVFLTKIIEKFGRPEIPISIRRPNEEPVTVADPAPGTMTVDQPGAERKSKNMTNDLAIKQQGSTALTADNDPFQAYADAIAPSFIVGKLLRFSKGDYLAGDDEVPEGTQLTVAVDELMAGWIKWSEGRPAEQIMVRIAEGKAPLKREELGDHDETAWEQDAQGERKDPWQFTNYVPMIDDRGELYTFTTSSRGGLGAIAQVARRYAQHRRRHRDVFPKITLRIGSYQHQNREYGRIKFPDFEPLGYAPKSEFYAALRAAGFVVPEAGEAPSAADAALPPAKEAFSDEIPF
jgi:hypothetical protein